MVQRDPFFYFDDEGRQEWTPHESAFDHKPEPRGFHGPHNEDPGGRGWAKYRTDLAAGIAPAVAGSSSANIAGAPGQSPEAFYARFRQGEMSRAQLESAISSWLANLIVQGGSQVPSDSELQRLALGEIKRLEASFVQPLIGEQNTGALSGSVGDQRVDTLSQDTDTAASKLAQAATDQAAQEQEERNTVILGQQVNETISLLDTGTVDPTNLRSFIQNHFSISSEEAQTVFNVIRNQRARLLEQQNAQDVFFRGAGEAFGRPVSDFTPFGQRALTSAFSRFRDINPITNFFPQQEQGVAFQSFLGGPRPTRSGLQGNLDQILQTIQGDPNDAQRALFQATFPTAQSAAAAASQPFLAGVSPRLRSSLSGILQNQFGSQFALAPEQFQTQQQIAGIFNTFRNQGF